MIGRQKTSIGRLTSLWIKKPNYLQGCFGEFLGRGLFRMKRGTRKLDLRWCWWQWDGHLWRSMGFVQFYRRVSRSEKKQRSVGIGWNKTDDETLKMLSLLWNLYMNFVCLSFDDGVLNLIYEVVFMDDLVLIGLIRTYLEHKSRI